MNTDEQRLIMVPELCFPDSRGIKVLFRKVMTSFYFHLLNTMNQTCKRFYS